MKLARELLFPLIAVACAFLVGGVVVLLIGDLGSDPTTKAQSPGPTVPQR